MPELVDTLVVGPLSCNCSIAADPASGDAVVIDPGGNGPGILEVLSAHGLTCKAIVHTHAHLDHFLGTGELARATGAPVWLHGDDVPLYEAAAMQAAMIGLPTPPDLPPVDRECVDGDILELGEQERIQVLHTPGHSPGSVCFHAERAELLFSGDTLFRMGVGRTDLWGGSYPTMMESIRARILSLPGSTRVIPGHGPQTTVEAEMRANPFLQV